MKILLSFILLNTLMTSTFSQNFEPAAHYAVTATRSLVTEEILSLAPDARPQIDCFVYHVSDTATAVIKIEPEEYEVFDSVQVFSLENPGLKNVKEVLRVEVEYSACCFWADISYYLVMNSGELIKLPDLHQAFCDWPAVIDEYYFPSQHSTDKNIIQSNAVSINSEGDIDNIKTNQLLLWNGKQISVPE